MPPRRADDPPRRGRRHDGGRSAGPRRGRPADRGDGGQQAIDGIIRLPPRLFEDERGLVRRDPPPEPAAEGSQTNLSFSRKGVIRGLHFHERGQDDLFVCLQGMARVVVLHRESGAVYTEDIGDDNRVALYVPVTWLTASRRSPISSSATTSPRSTIPRIRTSRTSRPGRPPHQAPVVDEDTDPVRARYPRVLITGARRPARRRTRRGLPAGGRQDARGARRHAAVRGRSRPRPARGRVDGRRRRRGRPARRVSGQRGRDAERRSARRADRLLLHRLRSPRAQARAVPSSRWTSGRSPCIRPPKSSPRGRVRGGWWCGRPGPVRAPQGRTSSARLVGARRRAGGGPCCGRPARLADLDVGHLSADAVRDVVSQPGGVWHLTAEGDLHWSDSTEAILRRGWIELPRGLHPLGPTSACSSPGVLGAAQRAAGRAASPTGFITRAARLLG